MAASISTKIHAAHALLSMLQEASAVNVREIRGVLKELMENYNDFDGCSESDVPDIVELAETIAQTRWQTLREAVWREEMFNYVAWKNLAKLAGGPKPRRARDRRVPVRKNKGKAATLRLVHSKPEGPPRGSIS